MSRFGAQSVSVEPDALHHWWSHRFGESPDDGFRAMFPAGRRLFVVSVSYARSRVWPAASALAACLGAAASPVLAGDGSGTDNPALLRGTYGLVCESGAPCVPSLAGWPTTRTQPRATAPGLPPTSGPGNCATLKAAGIYSAECAGVTQTPVQQPVPRAVTQPAPATRVPPPQLPQAAPTVAEPVSAPVDPMPTAAIAGPPALSDDGITGDWQIAMRGSSTWNGRGQRYAISVSPSGELTIHRVRGEMRLSAGLDLAYEPGGAVGIDGASGTFELDHTVTRDLMLRTAFRLDGARASVNALTTPTNVAQGALSLLGTAEAGIEYSAGRAGYSLSGSVSRQYVGDTVLVGGATQSNAARNWSGFGLTARASYELTPILSAYLEASANRAYYDAVTTGLGARADNWTYQGRVGLEGKWSNGLEASLYGGYALTDYDSTLVADGGGYVIGGSLAYPFLRTGEITAGLETGITPTGSVPGATTKVSYDGTLGISYMVNDWFTLRGALGGSWSVYPGASYDERGLSAGAGIDWTLGTHIALNADYSFGATFTPTAEDLSHTVSVGMTVSR